MLETLREEFRLAKKVFDEATERFDAVCPNPSANSSHRIKAASRELDSARERFMKDVTRLNEFIAHGRVPDDL
jgi:hypothetical protein